MQSSRKFLIALTILSFCALMTILLVRRERGGGSVVVVDENLRLDEPIETWLGFFAGEPRPEHRVGYAHLRQAPEPREGVEGTALHLDMQLQLLLFGRQTELALSGESWSAWRGAGREFDFTVRSAGSEFQLRGVVENERLSATVRSGGEEFPLDLAVPAAALLQPSLGSALQFPVLEVGQEVVLATFDPITLGPGRARVRAVRQQQTTLAGDRLDVRVYHVETSGFTTEAWVDDRGDIVRASTPLGLTLARIDPAVLEQPTATSLRDSDLLRQTAVFPGGAPVRRGARRIVAEVALAHSPGEPAALRNLATRRGAGPDGDSPSLDNQPLAPPQDAYQRRLDQEHDGSGTAGTEAGTEAAGFAPSTASRWEFSATPLAPGTTTPPGDAPQARHLAADAFIQSDHARIRERARALMAELPTTATDQQRAAHLYRWVWESLEKVPVLGVPSAIEVLETLRGDCNEHTILYTALARASGLPTRVAIGLVWSVDLGGFYYHAWPEVYLGTNWQRFDPTLGQERADATHIKLLEGSIERWPQLLAYLGKLQITVLEVE